MQKALVGKKMCLSPLVIASVLKIHLAVLRACVECRVEHKSRHAGILKRGSILLMHTKFLIIPTQVEAVAWKASLIT